MGGRFGYRTRPRVLPVRSRLRNGLSAHEVRQAINVISHCRIRLAEIVRLRPRNEQARIIADVQRRTYRDIEQHFVAALTARTGQREEGKP